MGCTVRQYPTGRVIEYDPKTDQACVLLETIIFANGIGVDPAGNILIGEPFSPKLIRYECPQPAVWLCGG